MSVRHACLRSGYVSKSTYEQMRHGRCLSGSCCPPLRSVIVVYPAVRSMGAVEVLADRSRVRSRYADPQSRHPRCAEPHCGWFRFNRLLASGELRPDIRRTLFTRNG